MLTPDYLGKIPNSLIKTYEQLEEFIIDDICRRIAKAGSITDTAKWQAERANEMGIYTDVLKKKVAETLNVSYKEVDKLFEDAAIKSTEADNAIYEQAKLTPMHLNTSKELQEYFLAAVKQTKGELKNISQSLGFCVRGVNGKVKNKSLTDTYIQALDLAQFKVSSGVTDYQTAVRQAVKTIASSGVRFINYESGYSNRIDVAVRRATVSGVNQMAAKMTELTMDELGIELVEVTAHAGARPSHAEWQGQVYSFKQKHSKYEMLEDATGYGRGEGLCGWNCRHNFFPYIEGSPRAYTKEQLRSLDNPPFGYKGRTYTHYEATQKQRQMETAIRKTKRELVGYNATGDKDAFTSASIKLQRQKQEYKSFSNKANLPIQMNRTQESKYGKSISQKAVWSNKKVHKIGSNDKSNIPDNKKGNQLSVNDCKKFAREKLGIYLTKFSGLNNSEVLKPLLDELVILKNQHGKMFNSIDVVDMYEKTIAQAVGNRLELNKRYFNSSEGLQKQLDEWNKNSYIPKGCNNIKYIATHEYYHLLTQYYIDDNMSTIGKIYDKANKNDFVSKNSINDVHEFVADLLAANKLKDIQNDSINKLIEIFKKEGIL